MLLITSGKQWTSFYQIDEFWGTEPSKRPCLACFFRIHPITSLIYLIKAAQHFWNVYTHLNTHLHMIIQQGSSITRHQLKSPVNCFDEDGGPLAIEEESCTMPSIHWSLDFIPSDFIFQDNQQKLYNSFVKYSRPQNTLWTSRLFQLLKNLRWKLPRMHWNLPNFKYPPIVQRMTQSWDSLQIQRWARPPLEAEKWHGFSNHSITVEFPV